MAGGLEVGEVRAVLSLDSTKFSSGLMQAFSSIGSIGSKFGPEGAVLAAGVIATAFSAAFALKVGEGIVAGLKSAFESAAAFEQTKMGFQTLFGGEAATFYPQLQQFGVESPFELKDLEGYTKRLKGVGFATEDIIPILEAAGDAAAALGDPSIVERVTYALGDMKTKGRVSAEEMSRQLASAGIPAWQMLADAIGLSVEETRKLAEEGEITAEVAIPAIVNGIKNSNMGGAMSDQMETFNGKLMMLRDTLELLKRDIGAPLVEAAGPLMDTLLPALQELGGEVKAIMAEHGPAFKKMWEDLGPVITSLVQVGLAILVEQLKIIADVLVIIGPAVAGVGQAFVNAFVGLNKIIYQMLVIPLNTVITALNTITGTNFAQIRMQISGNVGPTTGVNLKGGSKQLIPGAAEGGVLSGPSSGYLAMLHGTELVTPWDKVGASGPVFHITGSRADASAIAAEVRKVLRGEIGSARSRTALMGA